MKKRILALFLAAMLLLLCGCDRLSTAENLIGRWVSEDGYTVTFDGETMTLCGSDGLPADGFPAEYTVSGNYLYVMANGSYIDMFECRPDGDSLELIYTDSFLIRALGSAEKSYSISLVRC